MDTLLEAIVEYDIDSVRRLLKATPALAKQPITEPQLFTKKILHWLYVNDTPLHLAAAGHRAEIVQLLITKGADPNAANNHRRGTPLHYASDGCVGNPQYDNAAQERTIRTLISAGAHLNSQDKNGATPLHRAVRTRCLAAVKMLLDFGADPKIPNLPGSTPLHLAVQNTGRGGSGTDAAKAAQQQIVELLLANGGKPSDKNRLTGKTVFESASPAIRDLLR